MALIQQAISHSTFKLSINSKRISNNSFRILLMISPSSNNSKVREILLSQLQANQTKT